MSQKIKWFNDREVTNLDLRYKGLEFLEKKIEKIPNPISVLDLGGAEGSISVKLTKSKIANIDCVDYLDYEKIHPNINYIKKDLNYNVETLKSSGPYDIVLALAILQKLKNPSSLINILPELTKYFLAIRIPKNFDKNELKNLTQMKECFVDRGLPNKFIGELIIYNKVII